MQTTYRNFSARFNSIESKYAPEELHLWGDVSLLEAGKRASVIGSRKLSPEGIRRTRVLTSYLVGKGITVVSGLAEGVDAVSHKTAIGEGGRTIAVLGTPLSKAYPQSNSALLECIKNDHLAISQFAEGQQVQKGNFPVRNKTMALISDATIIVEASEQSGTRHQGWEALRLGRPLFIMANTANNPKLSWPQQMIGKGAQVLTRDNLASCISSILNQG